jgi:hypothetical protein
VLLKQRAILFGRLGYSFLAIMKDIDIGRVARVGLITALRVPVRRQKPQNIDLDPR